MGGIAGMIRFDGQAVDPTDAGNMISLLKHRGNVLSQPIPNGLLLAFGGTLDVSATAPLFAAIDADIFSNVSTNQPFTDNYIQSGPSSFDDLNADFAIALWDAHQQTLYCSRDGMGAKPLYYVYQPNRFFAFASEIKALTALREVVVKPNPFKFREYLTWTTVYVPYSAETFHETIYSVLPGHYLQVNSTAITEHPYWQLNLTKFKGINNTDEYSTLFRDYFTAAVNGRIKGKQRIGSHLSGGLDSSSVSCVAQSLLIQQHRPSLYTFNIDSEQPEAEEQAYVKSVVDQWHPNHYRVTPLPDVLDAILKINHIFDRPEQFIIPSSFHLSVSVKAQELGCDVLLTGHDGDSVITTGFDYLTELVEADQWDQFKLAGQQFIAPRDRNLHYVHANWLQLSDQDRYEKYVLSVVGRSLKKQIRQKSLATFLTTLREQKQRFGLSESAIFAYLTGRISDRLTRKALIDNALSEDFKRQVPQRPQRSMAAFVADLTAKTQVELEEVINTTNIICNEQMNHIGAYYGHPYSFPFFDKNVMELGLATPMSVRFDQGRGRGLIRHGLRDVLPAAVLSRVTKANFVEYGTLAAQQLYEATQEQFSSASHPIWGVIDRRIFSKIVATVYNPNFPVRRKTRYNWLLSRIIYLSVWLGSLERRN
ncbi:asparagine synthetase B [Spirosoma sp. KNUC1025]|uniref:asparagine synthetase B family protein n=1 Tax=Spirosoma sp. KNUC1025 TaxID=2894082 RepID=UPI0038708526|nr:asparagine synthase [Spirosoma sp. KNUC1025]